jgi:hypothetical protein
MAAIVAAIMTAIVAANSTVNVISNVQWYRMQYKYNIWG